MCAATAVKHVDDVEDERVPSLINISKISPVAYLPSLQVNKTHATDLETSSENSQKLQEGWIFVGRNREKCKELISHHNIDRTIVLPSESSLDLAKTAGRKTKAEKAVLSSESSFIDWLKPKITLCGKVVGVSVGNNQEDWERLIEFAQGRERLNSNDPFRCPPLIFHFFSPFDWKSSLKKNPRNSKLIRQICQNSLLECIQTSSVWNIIDEQMPITIISSIASDHMKIKNPMLGDTIFLPFSRLHPITDY